MADELRAIGVENPAQLGALFMADAEDLKQLTHDVAPVVDAFPYRIQLPYSTGRPFPPAYAWLMDTNRAQKRFTESTFIKQHWPVELVAESLPYFYYQRLINRKYSPGLDRNPPFSKDDLRRALVDTGLESLPLWMMGSNYYEQRLIDLIADDPRYIDAYNWGMIRRDIAERRFPEAMQRLEQLRTGTDPANRVTLDRLYQLLDSLKDYR